MIKHWTPEEEAKLLELKNSGMRLADIAVELGRSLEAVRTRSKRLKAQEGDNSRKGGNFSWTEEEVALLYEDLSYDELVELLNKSRRAVTSKCEKLGISKRFHNSSTGTQNPLVPATLYLIDFGDFKKVGVTQVPLTERFKQDKPYRVLDTCENMVLSDAIDTEREILKNMRKFKVIGDIRRGKSECFDFDCTQLSDLI